MTTTSGPLAVVTGASSGIGLALAKQFAEHGYDLIVTAEDEGIDSAARQVGSSGANVRAVRADLRTREGVEGLYAEVRDSPIDALALNAGVGVSGDFTRDVPLEDELNLLELNVVSTVHLAKRLLPDMVRRGMGRVLVTSSVAATAPGPFEATYAASKSFLQSFGQALRSELRGTGVSVTVLMPGVTDTHFFERAGMQDTKLGATADKDDPDDVARQGFEALMRGDDHVIAGSVRDKAMAASSRLLSEPARAEMHRKRTEPGSADPAAEP
ncbi:MAG TPA: SDR family NAD(P)-dependent oxidoreductase [Micromonosporaceae bacterium]|jgi:short-subunit dehydrogenase